MAIYYDNILLSNCTFDKEEKIFSLSNDENDYYINISYIPKLVTEEEEYKPEDYSVFLFENNHLNAENDAFQLYDKDKDERIGWIFPISILESNENDFDRNIHLNMYKLVVYKILLSNSFEYRVNINEINKSLSLSHIYGDDTIICILSKDKISEGEFNIHSYYPCLAIYGYFEKNNNKLVVKYPNNLIVETYRNKTKLYIKKTNNNILKLDFVKKLYCNYLKTLDHHLIRFHLLYQIIEYLITENFSSEFDQLLTKYNNNEITKNNFLEKINEIRSERKNIRKIIDKIKLQTDFEKQVNTDLKRTIKDFLRNFNIEENEHLGDLIYDMRNIIIHNYREIKDENLDLINEISYLFEILINVVIIKSP
ncbi:MAG: hypothetical protein AB1444_07095 [Spirochaetota bacterium]